MTDPVYTEREIQCAYMAASYAVTIQTVNFVSEIAPYVLEIHDWERSTDIIGMLVKEHMLVDFTQEEIKKAKPLAVLLADKLRAEAKKNARQKTGESDDLGPVAEDEDR